MSSALCVLVQASSASLSLLSSTGSRQNERYISDCVIILNGEGGHDIVRRNWDTQSQPILPCTAHNPPVHGIACIRSAMIICVVSKKLTNLYTTIYKVTFMEHTSALRHFNFGREGSGLFWNYKYTYAYTVDLRYGCNCISGKYEDLQGIWLQLFVTGGTVRCAMAGIQANGYWSNRCYGFSTFWSSSYTVQKELSWAGDSQQL